MEVILAIGVNLLVGALLLALFAWRRPTVAADIGTVNEARATIRESIPDAEGVVVLSADGDAALLLGPEPLMTCLMQRHGGHYNVRPLHPGEVGNISERDGSIRFRLRDFGWPECRLRIYDPQLRSDCLARLNALRVAEGVALPQAGSHA